MGWLIVTLVLAVALIFVSVKSYDDTPVDVLSGTCGFTSALAAVIIICCMVDVKPDAKAFIEKYDNFVTLANSVKEPSDAVIKEIIDINERILEHRTRSKNFMTRGLYSKDIAELNLLEVPEIWNTDKLE